MVSFSKAPCEYICIYIYGLDLGGMLLWDRHDKVRSSQEALISDSQNHAANVHSKDFTERAPCPFKKGIYLKL